jgi:hypothetical protein
MKDYLVLVSDVVAKYVRIKKKKKATSHKLQEGIDYEVDNIDDYIKRVVNE